MLSHDIQRQLYTGYALQKVCLPIMTPVAICLKSIAFRSVITSVHCYTYFCGFSSDSYPQQTCLFDFQEVNIVTYP